MSKAMKMCYLSMANATGIAMHNAVSNQKSGQVTATADTTVVCAIIIAKGTGSKGS